MNKPPPTLVPSLMLSSLLFFLPALARAQAAPAVPAEASPADAPPSDVAVPPAPDLPPPPPPLPGEPVPPPDLSAPPPASVEDRVGTLEGKVEGMDESLAAMRSTVDKLNRIKLSGYIQGRYEWHDDSTAGLNATGGVAERNRFFVRRGRLKVVYDGTNAEYLLQIDAIGAPSSYSLSEGVTLKDAEATFVDTWTPFNFRLTMGQFKWPFGYEILQSSADREMPERSAVIASLFPGERDRGMRLTGRYEWLRFAAALVNGNSTRDRVYGNNDQNSFKDVVLRVSGDFDFLVAGLSGYFGRRLDTTPATATAPVAYKRTSLVRLGADAQFYYDIAGLGGLAVKGEIVYAKDSDAGFDTVAANSCNDVTKFGWIVTVVQNVGDYMGAVLRLDSYDPNFSNALDKGCPAAKITAGQGDRLTTLGGGLLLYASGNLKGTMVYEHLWEQSNARVNDIFTAQLQARF